MVVDVMVEESPARKGDGPVLVKRPAKASRKRRGDTPQPKSCNSNLEAWKRPTFNRAVYGSPNPYHQVRRYERSDDTSSDKNLGYLDGYLRVKENVSNRRSNQHAAPDPYTSP